MKNQLKRLLKYYNQFKASDYFIIGFEYNNKIYFKVVKKIFSKWLKGSHKAGTKIFKANMYICKKQRQKWVDNNAICLCSMQEFLDAFDANNGWTLEKMIYKYYNIEFKGHDSVPFYKGNDITVNGIGYQIKWQDSQLVTEITINKLIKAL